jgi:hypothetical protein
LVAVASSTIGIEEVFEERTASSLTTISAQSAEVIDLRRLVLYDGLDDDVPIGERLDVGGRDDATEGGLGIGCLGFAALDRLLERSADALARRLRVC